MANSKEITRYKQQIASMLLDNERIVELIDNSKVEDLANLIGSSIHMYIRIPKAPEEEETHIAFEVDIPDATRGKNKLFKDVVITFYVITHERLMPVEKYGGIRTDLLSAEIDEMFSGYDGKGLGFGKIEFVSNVSGGIGVKHRCRIITFATQDLIDAGCV